MTLSATAAPNATDTRMMLACIKETFLSRRQDRYQQGRYLAVEHCPNGPPLGLPAAPGPAGHTFPDNTTVLTAGNARQGRWSTGKGPNGLCYR